MQRRLLYPFFPFFFFFFFGGRADKALQLQGNAKVLQDR